MKQQINLADVRPGMTIEVHGFREFGERYLVSRTEVCKARHFTLGELPYFRIYTICGLKLPVEKRRERIVFESFGEVDGCTVFLVGQ